jgi:hypothetical protein
MPLHRYANPSPPTSTEPSSTGRTHRPNHLDQLDETDRNQTAKASSTHNQAAATGPQTGINGQAKPSLRHSQSAATNSRNRN